MGGQEHYQFNGDVTLTFTFDPSKIPDGETPAVFYYDDTTGQWVDIGGTVNWNNDTITVTVDHFTKYAVMAVPKTQGASAFSDVPSSYWAYAAISSLSSQGIVSGYPDGTYRPDNTITRAEFATMLVKALGLSTTGTNGAFTDVTPGDWCYDYRQRRCLCRPGLRHRRQPVCPERPGHQGADGRDGGQGTGKQGARRQRDRTEFLHRQVGSQQLGGHRHGG